MASPSIYRDLQKAFQANLRGQAQFDPYTRALFSTDASNHLIRPLGVVTPKVPEDLQAIVETSRKMSVPLIPRGGGTGLAGQTLGEAVIVDCSKHLNRILEIDPEARQAVVQPGVVCSQLNRAAAAHGLMYGPDPASANRATVGGMIGNNATGAHSVRYGMTADHVVQIEAVLSDGSRVRFDDVGLEGARLKAREDTLEGRIYRRALSIREHFAQAVREHWPRTWRRASGYSLNYLTGFSAAQPAAWYRDPEPYFPESRFHLGNLICSSEGTLALIGRATLNLVPVPRESVLLTLGFDSAHQAAEFTPALLETEPDAIELIPAEILNRARGIPAYSRKLTFVDEIPDAMLVVEYTADTQAEAKDRAEPYASRGSLLVSATDRENLWEVRKAGLGLLMSVPGDTKPITFIEDVAVPVEELSNYVGEVEGILAAHGTTAEWYAHASAGCLHLRPLINLKTDRGVSQMRAIANQVADLVLALGGSLSGEHGDGFSHTEFNEKLFGPELYSAFRELKAAFDPEGLLNPGKVVDNVDLEPALDKRLRFGAGYSTTIPIQEHFAFTTERDLAGAVEACTGLGVCRKDDGVMCPSYQATRDERDSTRGRANAMRAALSGLLPAEALREPAMYRIFDLCLECKACKAECPTGVDMARVKAEYLDYYQAENGTPLRSRVFAEVREVSRRMRPFAWLVNRLSQLPGAPLLIEFVLGISRHRSLPRFHRTGFLDHVVGHSSDKPGHDVVFFVDTYSEMNDPDLAKSSKRVLEAAGYRVIVIPQQACCGRPMISKGLLDRAKVCADQNLELLYPFAESGVPIVGIEPSCLLTLRDEYLEFFPEDPRAGVVASKAFLMEEFLLEADRTLGRPIEKLDFRNSTERVSLHTHCHAKSLIGSDPTVHMLEAAGLDVELIDSGCCGMAGSFGLEKEHYQVSMKIGEDRLFPAVRSGLAEGRTIAAHGVSCRTQIADGPGATAVHPVTLIERRLV